MEDILQAYNLRFREYDSPIYEACIAYIRLLCGNKLLCRDAANLDDQSGASVVSKLDNEYVPTL